VVNCQYRLQGFLAAQCVCVRLNEPSEISQSKGRVDAYNAARVVRCGIDGGDGCAERVADDRWLVQAEFLNDRPYVAHHRQHRVFRRRGRFPVAAQIDADTGEIPGQQVRDRLPRPS
jgi:hypothetical protein